MCEVEGGLMYLFSGWGEEERREEGSGLFSVSGGFIFICRGNDVSCGCGLVCFCLSVVCIFNCG